MEGRILTEGKAGAGRPGKRMSIGNGRGRGGPSTCRVGRRIRGEDWTSSDGRALCVWGGPSLEQRASAE